MAVATLATTAQSCMSLGGTAASIGLSILKNILLGGMNNGLNIFSDPNKFLANALVEAALPKQIKDLNSTLERIGLSSLVQKEKQYIAQAATFTVDIARPIMTNAINQMTVEDAIAIARGGKGAATQYLREKTQQQLMAAIQPKVDAKLNEFGLVQSLNSALSGNGLTGFLGNILGVQTNTNSTLTNGLSTLAAQQMVNGLFNIIENHEQSSAQFPINIAP